MRTRLRSMTVAALMVAAIGWGTLEPVAASRSMAPADAASGSAVNVAIRDNFFSPRNISITVGTSVTWVNRGEDDHTTTSSMGLWNAELSPGESFTRVFNRRGTFRYFCSFHDEMTGAIRVSP